MIAIANQLQDMSEQMQREVLTYQICHPVCCLLQIICMQKKTPRKTVNNLVPHLVDKTIT